jgi:ferritin-like metal-binding protein YciE
LFTAPEATGKIELSDIPLEVMAMAQTRTAARKRVHSTRQTARRKTNGEKISSREDLFKHELKDIYTAEHLLMEALKKLESESTHPELARAFAKHREETAGHIERLEAVGESIGEELEVEECPGIEGLLEEKKTFMAHKPTKEIVQVFNIGAGQKSERYEITSYEGLIELAKKLGFSVAVADLSANLAEEEAALKKLKTLSQAV